MTVHDNVSVHVLNIGIFMHIKHVNIMSGRYQGSPSILPGKILRVTALIGIY